MEESSSQNPPLISSENWLELVRKAPCGYCVTDANGLILRVNATFLDWIKYSKEEIEGVKRFKDLISIGGKIFYETKHAPLLKLQEEVNEINYNLVTKDGQRKTILLNSSRQLDKKGKIKFMQFVLLPFSERKKYEQELLNAKKKSQEAVESKTIFLSTVSHEIRTPIHAILNAGNLLVKENPLPEQKELLEVIQYSSHHLLELINSILDLNKMEKGKVAITQKEFNTRTVFNEIFKIFNPLSQSKGLDFDVIISKDVPAFLIGDESKIRQVVTNLIGNAIKFTHEGKVQLNISLIDQLNKDCTIRFELIDTGIGMNQEELDNIFSPFTQANEYIHSEYGGSGLGLTISQKMLNFLGSQLIVKSELGQGSTFYFDLKLEEGVTVIEATLADSTSSPQENLSGIRVLIVDDIYSNILILKRYFKIWKTPFEYAINGKDAISKVQEKDFDLVLMDINMPELDGYESTKEIRKLPSEKFKTLPIIGLSANDPTETMYKVKRCGMNGFIQKPFQPNDLFDAILKIKLSAQEKITTIQYGNPNVLDLDTVSSGGKDNLDEFFDQDQDAINEFLSVAISNLNEVIQEFILAESKFSYEDFENAAHKCASIMGIFELNNLKSKMTHGKKLIKNKEKLSFIKCSQGIILELSQLINWMQNRIEKK